MLVVIGCASITACGTSDSPDGTYLAVKSRNKQYGTASPDVTMADDMVEDTGGGQAFGIMQPYLVLHYNIAMVGIYPSRN